MFFNHIQCPILFASHFEIHAHHATVRWKPTKCISRDLTFDAWPIRPFHQWIDMPIASAISSLSGKIYCWMQTPQAAFFSLRLAPNVIGAFFHLASRPQLFWTAEQCNSEEFKFNMPLLLYMETFWCFTHRYSVVLQDTNQQRCNEGQRLADGSTYFSANKINTKETWRPRLQLLHSDS